jgi:serine/threonine protein kinase
MEERRDPLKFNARDLKKTHRLGRGAFSDVYLVVTSTTADDIKHHHQQLALKQLNLRSIKCQESFDIAAMDLIEEAKVLSKLAHPNIIDLRGIANTDPQTFLSQGYKEASTIRGTNYFLLLDAMLESLGDRLKRWSRDENFQRKGMMSRIGFRKGRFQSNPQNLDTMKMFERIESVAVGISRAMEYLHNQNIIFQDLKPGKSNRRSMIEIIRFVLSPNTILCYIAENIGFETETDQVKLFDFGMARTVDAETGTIVGSTSRDILYGTPRYMAPEVFQCKGGTKKTDVYSFGILLYVICTMNASFGTHQGVIEYRDHVCAGGRPNLDEIPDKATNRLISECLSRPKQRPSFVEIANFRLIEILNKNDKSSRSMTVRSDSAVSSIASSS